MINKVLLASALALGGFSTVAQARLGEGGDGAARGAAQAPGLIQLAQVRDVEIYYDQYGREVLVDVYTGEVVAIRERRDHIVRPPADAWDEPVYEDDWAERRRERRERRMRELGRGLPDEPALPRYDDFRTLPEPAYPEQDYGYGEDGGFENDFAREEPWPAQPESAPAPSQPGGSIVRVPLDQPGAGEPPADVARGMPGVEDGIIIEEQPGEPAITGPAVRPDLALGGASEDIAAIQIVLDRVGASPGVIDGRMGDNVNKAISAYRDLRGRALRTYDKESIEAVLAETGGDAFTTYEIQPVDVAGPYVASIPEDYGAKSRMERMGYTSVAEMLAERFHMDERFLRTLNPGVSFDRPGTRIKVANVGEALEGKVARIVADKGQRQVRAYGENGRLIAVYPSTIGSQATPSPTGTHAVERIAFDPEYTYNPKVNFQQGDNTSVLTIPPGPNGPVGTIWIALSKPTYGIHGTPEPSKIGKTESNGCIRLTNWDAQELAKMVEEGTSVEFVE